MIHSLYKSVKEDIMPIEDLTDLGGLSQGSMNAKMSEIARWMQKYEKERDAALPEASILTPTSAPAKVGYCFGLCMMLLTSVAVSEEIIRKQNLDPKYKPKDNADTIDSMYAQFASIAKAQIPEDNADPATKEEFYQKMQIFHALMEQAQKGIAAMYFIQDTTKAMNTFAPKSTASDPKQDISQDFRVLKTHYFTTPESLVKWSQMAKPGDMLKLGSKNHAMAIYARTSKEGDTIIGFYDPNNSEKIEISQKDIVKLPDAFQPFQQDYHQDKNGKDVEKYLVCDHVASSALNHTPFDIPNDVTVSSSQQIKNNCTISSIKNNDLEGIKYLLSIGANDVNNILYTSAINNADKIIEFILREYPKEAELGAAAALQTAAQSQAIDVMKQLLTLDVCASSDSMLKTLLSALVCNSPDAVELLLERKPELMNEKYDSLTLFQTAAFNGSLETMRFLEQKGAAIDLSVKDTDGNTVLHSKNILSTNTLKFLLDNGANINGLNKKGCTPLREAIERNDDNRISWLLGYGADHNIDSNFKDLFNKEKIEALTSDIARACYRKGMKFSDIKNLDVEQIKDLTSDIAKVNTTEWANKLKTYNDIMSNDDARELLMTKVPSFDDLSKTYNRVSKDAFNAKMAVLNSSTLKELYVSYSHFYQPPTSFSYLSAMYDALGKDAFTEKVAVLRTYTYLLVSTNNSIQVSSYSSINSYSRINRFVESFEDLSNLYSSLGKDTFKTVMEFTNNNRFLDKDTFEAVVEVLSSNPNIRDALNQDIISFYDLSEMYVRLRDKVAFRDKVTILSDHTRNDISGVGLSFNEWSPIYDSLGKDGFQALFHYNTLYLVKKDISSFEDLFKMCDDDKSTNKRVFREKISVLTNPEALQCYKEGMKFLDINEMSLAQIRDITRSGKEWKTKLTSYKQHAEIKESPAADILQESLEKAQSAISTATPSKKAHSNTRVPIPTKKVPPNIRVSTPSKKAPPAASVHPTTSISAKRPIKDAKTPWR